MFGRSRYFVRIHVRIHLLFKGNQPRLKVRLQFLVFYRDRKGKSFMMISIVNRFFAKLFEALGEVNGSRSLIVELMCPFKLLLFG